MTEKNFEKLQDGACYLLSNQTIGIARQEHHFGNFVIAGYHFDESGRCYSHAVDVEAHIKYPDIQPLPGPKKKHTSLCWIYPDTGALAWGGENPPNSFVAWKRFPAGDITGDIEE